MINVVLCESADEWLKLSMEEYMLANLVVVKTNDTWLIKKDRANPIEDQKADWREVCDRIQANLEY